ncbi:flippase-like domain-containing protein [Sandaracinus amylolyticus]|uniref:flippase-like domain-containing protein n=1 Tax=Sandaracinus amylolyticus TaxID=927083 RepID=UPI001F18CB1F|nr:flippase-like domain-containing protein [Sandaracinus amylolyticus]UJR81009.1 Holliday junction resolvasome, helicase subunit [Sandaracinus amylolyticus]
MSAPDSDPAAPSMTAGSTEKQGSARWRWIKRIGRALLFVLGVTAVVLLVREAGPDRVLETLVQAGPWIPLIVLLECCFMGMDVVALRGLMGERGRRVPVAVWVRTAFLQYGVMQLLPAGRAGGEVARAAGLSPYVGGAARAAAAATRLQAATLLGNTIISIPCAIGVALAVDVPVAESPLFWAIIGNGLITAVIGGAIVLASRKSSLGEWLGRRVPMLAAHGTSFDAALRQDTPWSPAIVATAIGRAFQTLQYGLILLAVGGSLTIVSALVSQGIHLVGAGMGDMVPNQVGITEGAYRLFAPALGLEHEAARAIGIALVARICQFSLAGTCLIVSALWKASPADVAVDDGATVEP